MNLGDYGAKSVFGLLVPKLSWYLADYFDRYAKAAGATKFWLIMGADLGISRAISQICVDLNWTWFVLVILRVGKLESSRVCSDLVIKCIRTWTLLAYRDAWVAPHTDWNHWNYLPHFHGPAPKFFVFGKPCNKLLLSFHISFPISNIALLNPPYISPISSKNGTQRLP